MSHAVTESAHHSDALDSIRRYSLWGTFFSLAFLLCVVGWGFFARVSGAVISPGAVSVISDLKKVQSSVPGVVSAINVRDGQQVHAGETLVKLDETVALANLALVEKSLNELYARRSRLVAERDGVTSVEFPNFLDDLIDEKTISAIKKNESRLFELRRTAYEGRKSQLKEQILQVEQEINGYKRQITSNSEQRKYIEQELQSVKTLWESKLVPLSRMSALEREAARLEGERGQLEAAVAQMSGKSAELKLAILQVDKDVFSDVALESRDVDAKIIQLEEQMVAAKDQLKKMVLVAPQDGVIHQLSVKTVGGVVAAGEVLMLVVPTADPIVIDAKLNPTDIDQVAVGSEAVLRFSAFNQRTTPELTGYVDFVSADTTTNPNTGATYYTARISVSEEERRKLNGLSLVPGMPVEVFIKTGERRVLSLLTKPLLDQMNRAFRQD